MQLRLIYGRAGAGKTMCCLNSAADLLQDDKSPASIIILVPEQATFDVERRLAAKTEGEAFADAHVVGFRRLGERVLTETGGLIKPRLTDLGKKMALRRLLLAHEKDLKILSRAAKQRTFTDTLTSAIWEFKTWCITPAMLEKVGQDTAEGALKDKVADLALLYRQFEEFMDGSYHDAEDVLQLLAERIPTSPLMRGAQVYVDGFHWFTPQEKRVLTAIMRTAACVTVTLCMPFGTEECSDNDLFYRQWQTERSLRETALQNGLNIEEILLPADKGRFANAPVLDYIERNFYGGSGEKFDGDNAAITIGEAANRRAEAEGIAREIIRLARERGYRWRDMAIILRDTEAYSELLETAFTDYNIPFFSDRRRPASHHPIAELIRSAVETVRLYWSYDPIFRALKTGMFPVDADSIDILENYCLEFGIKGRRWLQSEPWEFIRRLSLEEDIEKSERDELNLAAINATRDTVRAPLMALQEEMEASSTVRGYTLAVYNFLTELKVAERLESWADAAAEAGNQDERREHHQLWAGVVGLLEQLVDTCGDEEMPQDEFAQILTEGLDALALSLIPPSIDHVILSSSDRGKTLSVKAVFVPGANDGMLPQRAREEGLITDAERKLLGECGLILAPGAVPDSFNEQFTVYTALTRAAEYLWLSYSLADEEGKALTPSMIIDRLKNLGAVGQVRSLNIHPPLGLEEEFLVHPGRALSALPLGLKMAVAEDAAENSVWWQVYNWLATREKWRTLLWQSVAGLFHCNTVQNLPSDAARGLYFKNGRLRGSVTRFEGYNACPFKYFACYGLRLQPRSVAKLKSPDFGQFMHAVLKVFGDELRAEGRQWSSLDMRETAERCERITESLAPRLQNEILLSSPHYRHIQKRLAATAACSLNRIIGFTANSAFSPFMLEQSFGRGAGGWPALEMKSASGLTVELAGQIDRLDKAVHEEQEYLLVVDYKTGQASLALSDVVYGLKLQLLTYLMAACTLSGGEPLPAGALYAFVKNPRIADKKMLTAEEIEAELCKSFKMPGWVLADTQIVKLLDESIDGWSNFIRVWMKNDKFRTDFAGVKTLEEFSRLIEHVKETVLKAAEEIAAGKVSISPYKCGNRIPCDFCDYAAVCQFDLSSEGNEYRNLPMLTDEEAWERLKSNEEEKI